MEQTKGEGEANLLGQTASESSQDGDFWIATYMDIEQHRVTVDLVDQHMLPHLAR